MTPNPDATGFLNVDLELVATTELSALVEHLKPATFVLRDSVDDGRRTIWLELAADPRDADDAILQYAVLVESLPKDMRRLWDACDDRCLNIGVESGLAQHSRAFRISEAAIAQIAAMAARVEITVYREDGEPDRSHQKIS